MVVTTRSLGCVGRDDFDRARRGMDGDDPFLRALAGVEATVGAELQAAHDFVAEFCFRAVEAEAVDASAAPRMSQK